MVVFDVIWVISLILSIHVSPIKSFHIISSPVNGGPTRSMYSLPGTARLTTTAVKVSKSLHAPLFSTSSSSPEDSSESSPSMRDKLRSMTGFSLTAFRSAWRAATGISLTALYASAVAVTGLWIRKVMSVILAIFPAWFRYFVQPFLVLYYAPLFILRGLTGPTRKRAKAKHEHLVDGWKHAVEFAEQTEKDGYSPVIINGDGDFELVKPPKPGHLLSEDLADAVADSVEQALEHGYKEEKDNDDSNKE